MLSLEEVAVLVEVDLQYSGLVLDAFLKNSAVDPDCEGGTRQQLGLPVVVLPDNQLGILGIGEVERLQLFTAPQFRLLIVGGVNQVARRGLGLNHPDSPGVLGVVQEPLVGVIVDIDFAAALSGIAANLGAINENVKGGAVQGLAGTGCSLQDLNLRELEVLEHDIINDELVVVVQGTQVNMDALLLRGQQIAALGRNGLLELVVAVGQALFLVAFIVQLGELNVAIGISGANLTKRLSVLPDVEVGATQRSVGISVYLPDLEAGFLRVDEE